MAGFEQHLVGNEFSAGFLNELDRVVAAVGDDAEEVRVVEAETVLQAVFNEELLAVLDALGFLHGVDRAGDVAAADGGVAADDRHLLNHENLLAAAGSLEGAGHAGEAGADDDDVVLGVKLLHLSSRNAGIGGSARHQSGGHGSAGLEEAAAGEIQFGHCVFL